MAPLPPSCFAIVVVAAGGLVEGMEPDRLRNEFNDSGFGL